MEDTDTRRDEIDFWASLTLISTGELLIPRSRSSSSSQANPDSHRHMHEISDGERRRVQLVMGLMVSSYSSSSISLFQPEGILLLCFARLRGTSYCWTRSLLILTVSTASLIHGLSFEGEGGSFVSCLHLLETRLVDSFLLPSSHSHQFSSEETSSTSSLRRATLEKLPSSTVRPVLLFPSLFVHSLS